jgi:fructokinase
VIVVGGEALMDLLVSPGGEVMLRPGGGSFNVARTVARLGAPTMFLGRLSDDGFGRSLRRVLLEDGVALACPDPLPAPTTLAVADLDAEGQARYRFYLAATSAVGLVDEDTAPALATMPTAVHVGSLGLVAEPVASALEAFVGNLPADVLVIVDPNCRPGAIADGPAYRARLSRILRRCDGAQDEPRRSRVPRTGRSRRGRRAGPS